MYLFLDKYSVKFRFSSVTLDSDDIVIWGILTEPLLSWEIIRVTISRSENNVGII